LKGVERQVRKTVSDIQNKSFKGQKSIFTDSGVFLEAAFAQSDERNIIKAVTDEVLEGGFGFFLEDALFRNALVEDLGNEILNAFVVKSHFASVHEDFSTEHEDVFSDAGLLALEGFKDVVPKDADDFVHLLGVIFV